VFKHGNFKEIITVLRIAFTILFKGSYAQKQGVFHFFLMQFGKQVVI
jgi:hypothetical protein